MATRLTPWDTRDSSGNSGKYYEWRRQQQGEGGSFPVGSRPGGFTSGVGIPVGNPYANQGMGMPPEARDSIDRARQRLAAGTYAGSTFGQTLQSRYMNPYGYDPNTRRRLEVQAEERLAGRMANSKDNARLYANATGALDSAGLAHLNSQLEAGTARDLNAEMTAIAQQDEEMRLQRELGSAGFLTDLFGYEQGKDIAAANFEGNIQWPTGGAGGMGGSTPWVGQGEQNLLDPNGGINFNLIYGMGGNRDYWMQMARKQREQYERWKASNGGQAA